MNQSEGVYQRRVNGDRFVLLLRRSRATRWWVRNLTFLGSFDLVRLAILQQALKIRWPF